MEILPMFTIYEKLDSASKKTGEVADKTKDTIKKANLCVTSHMWSVICWN